MVQRHGNVEVVLSSDLHDGVDILEIGFVGREGVVADPGLLTVDVGFVPSPTPISITCAKTNPFCLRFSMIVRASSREYSRKSCHWVVPSQKTGRPFWLVRQDGGVTAPRAGRDRPGWPMAAHQLASAYSFLTLHARPAENLGNWSAERL